MNEKPQSELGEKTSEIFYSGILKNLFKYIYLKHWYLFIIKIFFGKIELKKYGKNIITKNFILHFHSH